MLRQRESQTRILVSNELMRVKLTPKANYEADVLSFSPWSERIMKWLIH